MSLRRYIILMVAILAATSCSRPINNSTFCEFPKGRGWQESVTLELDMEDTVETQQIDICLQIVNKESINNCPTIDLAIEIVPPSGKHYKENIKLPVNVVGTEEVQTIHSGIRTIQWPYRKRVINRDPGRWEFTLTPIKTDNNIIFKEIIGLGITCKTED